VSAFFVRGKKEEVFPASIVPEKVFNRTVLKEVVEKAFRDVLLEATVWKEAMPKEESFLLVTGKIKDMAEDLLTKLKVMGEEEDKFIIVHELSHIILNGVLLNGIV
jgi:hypothetical protein